MTQLLYAKNVSLGQLEETFGLRLANSGALLTFPEEQLPETNAVEIQALERIQQHYTNLARQEKALEEAVKIVIISPLLDLAGFFDAPFGIETERSIEIEEQDEDVIIHGAIDILIVQKQLWIVVVESKRLGLDVMVALPQALAAMLVAPDQQQTVFGLLTNGREFVFVQLTRTSPPEYSLSPSFALFPDNQLAAVLQRLKYLGQTIAPPQTT